MLQEQLIYSSLGDDPDLGELVSIYIEEIPGKIADFESIRDAGDWESLRRAAHQMKGAAGSYGFPQITPVAAKLERVVNENVSIEVIEDAVRQLVEMCRCLRAGSPR